MSIESLMTAPPVQVQPPAPVLPPGELAFSGEKLPPPTAEQVQAVDHVFSSSREPDLCASLVGVWTGLLLLKDLAIDNFHEEELDDEPRKKDPEKPDE